MTVTLGPRVVGSPPWLGVDGAAVLAKLYIKHGCFGPSGLLRRFRRATHRANRFGSEHELPRLRVYLGQPSQEHMITAAGIDDQELAVAPEFASINDPTVTRRRDLGHVACLEHQPLGLSAVLRALAERENATPLRRQRQAGAREVERNGGLDAPRVPRHRGGSGRRELHD